MLRCPVDDVSVSLTNVRMIDLAIRSDQLKWRSCLALVLDYRSKVPLHTVTRTVRTAVVVYVVDCRYCRLLLKAEPKPEACKSTSRSVIVDRLMPIDCSPAFGGRKPERLKPFDGWSRCTAKAYGDGVDDGRGMERTTK